MATATILQTITTVGYFRVSDPKQAGERNVSLEGTDNLMEETR